ncbi:MAG: isoprenylcysteine carboxylmethyltransferase family protein [Pseudomonadota bacterium]
MKWIDIPPVWLAGFVALAWMQKSYLPQLTMTAFFVSTVGVLLIIGGVALMVLAVVEMRRQKTTPIPHMEPNALVTGGVFTISRNPIYLGDVLVLIGLIMWWGAWPSVILVPLFTWVITRRFILAEEQRLERAFGDAFRNWTTQTRRWI